MQITSYVQNIIVFCFKECRLRYDMCNIKAYMCTVESCPLLFISYRIMILPWLHVSMLHV